MVNRVVATKLTEEEHTKLLDLCNTKGCTPSALLKEAIMERIKPASDTKKEMASEQIRKFIGVTTREIGLD